MEADAPEQAHREYEAERRHDHRDQRHDLADPARARADRPDRGHRFRSALEPRAVDVHVGPPPVGVRLAAPRSVELLVERARQALVVADHVGQRDAVPRHQPGGQRERDAHLRRVAEHLGVGESDVLDPDRDLVQPDRVPAHDVERHELVDRPVAVDDEVRARAGQLSAARRRERRLRTCCRPTRSVVVAVTCSTIDARMQDVRVDAVVPLARTAPSPPCAWRRTGSASRRCAASAARAAPRRGRGRPRAHRSRSR